MQNGNSLAQQYRKYIVKVMQAWVTYVYFALRWKYTTNTHQVCRGFQLQGSLK